MEKVNFQSEGERVEGTLFIPDNGKENPGVIFFHGSGSSENNYIPLAEALSKNGIAALTFNFRGHANVESLENMTAYDGVSDGLAAYDFFIKQKGVHLDKIGVCGGSFGAVVATYLSEKRKTKSIALRAPALYKKDMMNASMGKILTTENIIFNDMHSIKDAEMMKIISAFDGSLLVVQSEKDDLIPASLSEAFFNEAKNTKRKEIKIIKNAPHSIKDPGQRQELIEIITEWFRETL